MNIITYSISRTKRLHNTVCRSTFWLKFIGITYYDVNGLLVTPQPCEPNYIELS